VRRAWLILALVAGLAGCGSSGPSSSTTSTSKISAAPAPSTAPARPAGACRTAQSPKTSASFYSLVKQGFFDGLTFHRVAAGFVIQGGDPTGTGAGGPGYTVVEEPPKNTQYLLGDVAMAKTQTQPAGASGSQFFIVTAPNVTQSAGLTPDYALVGKVSSGIDVVEKIGSLPTNPPQDGSPSPPVVMSKVTVSTG